MKEDILKDVMSTMLTEYIYITGCAEGYLSRILDLIVWNKDNKTEKEIKEILISCSIPDFIRNLRDKEVSHNNISDVKIDFNSKIRILNDMLDKLKKEA